MACHGPCDWPSSAAQYQAEASVKPVPCASTMRSHTLQALAGPHRLRSSATAGAHRPAAAARARCESPGRDSSRQPDAACAWAGARRAAPAPRGRPSCAPACRETAGRSAARHRDRASGRNGRPCHCDGSSKPGAWRAAGGCGLRPGGDGAPQHARGQQQSAQRLEQHAVEEAVVKHRALHEVRASPGRWPRRQRQA